MQGIQWRAEKLWLEGDVSFPAGGRIVKANIRSLQAVEPRTQFGHQLNATGYAVIPGRYRFPSRRVEWNESREKYGKCELNLQGKLCTVLCYEDRLEIRFEIPASAPVEEYAQRLLQAIGFSIGAFLSPILEGTNDQSDRYQIVNARRKDIEVARILPPIPTSFPQHEANIEGLVNSFLSRAPEPYPKFLGYWYRILISTDGDVENQALVLSTAIEGVAKTYFCEQLKADDMYVAEVDAAIPLLNALDIGSRAKDFVIQSLHGSKGSNVKNALHKLAALGLITDDLIKIWKRLRNKSAHADGLQMGDADLQRLIDDIHSCLELFYRLVLAHIAYAGPFLRYSESGGEAGTPPTGQLPLA